MAFYKDMVVHHQNQINAQLLLRLQMTLMLNSDQCQYQKEARNATDSSCCAANMLGTGTISSLYTVASGASGERRVKMLLKEHYQVKMLLKKHYQVTPDQQKAGT